MDNTQVNITQSVAILIDGNNIERSLHSLTGDVSSMINFDTVIPKLLNGRGLSRLIYFREGSDISSKLADRLLTNFMGSVVPCHKSADIPLTISATQIARKVDTIIVLSGDSDYVELLRHLKGEGVRVEVAAVIRTTASILIEEADHFVPIGIEDSFSLSPKKRRHTASKSKTTPKKAPIKTKVSKTPKTNEQKNTKPASKKTSNNKPVTKSAKNSPRPKQKNKRKAAPKKGRKIK